MSGVGRLLPRIMCLQQGIIDMNRNGNSAIVFSYVCNGKKIKELFSSTLDRIPITVRCVSSIIVVLGVKFAYCLRRTKKKKNYGENRRSPTTVPCFASWDTLTFNFNCSLHSARKTSLLYIFQRSMQANKNINLWYEKAPIYRLSRDKAPKTQQICHYRHARKTRELFLLFNTGADFSLHNNFANSGSFAKVSVPVHIYNSLTKCISKTSILFW